MRVWIEYLMGNTAAYQDYLAWLSAKEDEIKRKIILAAKNNKSDELPSLSLQLHVYDNLKTTFISEFREHRAKVQRENERNM